MKRTIIALFFVLCVIGFSVIWLLQNRSPIDQTTYDAIVLGLPENEAMNLVPISPRDPVPISRAAQLLAEAGKAEFKDDEVFVKRAEDGASLYFDATTKNELGKMRVWDTDEYSLVLLFSSDGKVMGKRLWRFVDTDTGWWNALRRFLRL